MSGTRIPTVPAQREHGGTTGEANLAFTCWRCNRHKGTDLASIDPDTGAFCRLFDPRAQWWRDHFAVREGVIVGVAPEGHATARAARATMIVAVNERATAQVTADQPARGGGWSRKTREETAKEGLDAGTAHNVL